MYRLRPPDFDRAPWCPQRYFNTTSQTDSWTSWSCLEEITYKPENCLYIKSDAQVTRETYLQTDDLAHALQSDEQHVGNAEPSTVSHARLKLIIGNPIKHERTKDPTDDLSVVPFSRESLEFIVSHFRLPSLVTHSICDLQPSSARFMPNGKGRPRAYLFHLSWIARCIIAISYDADAGLCCVWIHGFADGIEHDKIVSLVKQCTALSVHPMFMPIAISEVHLACLKGEVDAGDWGVFNVELTTGQHSYRGFARDNEAAVDYGAATRSLNVTSTALGLVEARLKWQKSMFKTVKENIEDLAKATRFRVGVDLSREGNSLLDRMAYLESQVDCLLAKTEHILRKCQTWQTVIYNLIAQRDSKTTLAMAKDSKVLAEATKHDSDSMKTLAVLSMLFLPGTFVAAFFAMPLFNWQARHVSSIVSERLWVYAVVAIPLTVLVVLLWYLWLRGKLPWLAVKPRQDVEKV